MSAIEKIIAERGIETLLHFTPIGNLKNIFANGLLPYDDPRHTKAAMNDKYDKNGDSVCLSITQLSKMFFAVQNNSLPESWCVIELAPILLDELQCRFYPINGVSKVLRTRSDAEFCTSDALAGMFADEVQNPEGEYETRDPHLDANQTTNQQAEVRVAGGVAPHYFRRIYFHEKTNDATINRLDFLPSNLLISKEIPNHLHIR